MSKQNRDPHSSPLPAGIVELSVYRPPHITDATPDFLAEEVPVALVYNGISHVVMMASPKDLELFAIGFSLSEGIIEHPQDIYGMDVVQACNGLEVQIELSSRRSMGLKERRRALAGRTGCGVCGVEQLNDIGKPVSPLPFTQTLIWRTSTLRLSTSTMYSLSASSAAARTRRRGYCRRERLPVGMKTWAATWRWISCSVVVHVKVRFGSRAPRSFPAAPAMRWCKNRRCAGWRSCLPCRRQRRWRWRWPSAAT